MARDASLQHEPRHIVIVTEQGRKIRAQRHPGRSGQGRGIHKQVRF